MAYLDQIDTSRLVALTGVGTPTEEVLSDLTDQNVPVTVGTFWELDREARQRGLAVYRALFGQEVVDIIATNETALASQADDTFH